MHLSIIIPAYNEHKKIPQDIVEAAAFLQRHNIQGEIIIVDDGSSDYTAETAILVDTDPGIKKEIIHFTVNHGKGFAVSQGMMQSSGDYVMFIDSGNTIPWDMVLLGLKLLRNNECELAIASRRLPESNIVRPHLKSRRFTSLLFRQIVKLILNIPGTITDSQCGLKLYKGDIGRQLYSDCKTYGYLFDIEIILKAIKHGYRIKEFPIDWYADSDTRLSQSRMLFKTLHEIWQIHKVMKKYQPDQNFDAAK